MEVSRGSQEEAQSLHDSAGTGQSERAVRQQHRAVVQCLEGTIQHTTRF
jgi:hypothetical protein